MRSAAYTGPDDWQQKDYELETEEGYVTLEIAYDIFLGRAIGDFMNITSCTVKETGEAFELNPKQSARVLEFLRENYEPTEDL